MSWAEFEEPRRKARPTPEQEQAEKNRDRKYARVLGAGEGQQLLEELLDEANRPLGPNASDSALRFREGQRYLVHQLALRTKRGLDL